MHRDYTTQKSYIITVELRYVQYRIGDIAAGNFAFNAYEARWRGSMYHDRSAISEIQFKR